jgi:hypothetical protein
MWNRQVAPQQRAGPTGRRTARRAQNQKRYERGMITALKMIAEMIADEGCPAPCYEGVERPALLAARRVNEREDRGQDREVLRRRWRREGGQGAARDEQLLPTSTISMSFVGSRSTMRGPRAAWVPVSWRRRRPGPGPGRRWSVADLATNRPSACCGG